MKAKSTRILEEANHPTPIHDIRLLARHVVFNFLARRKSWWSTSTAQQITSILHWIRQSHSRDIGNNTWGGVTPNISPWHPFVGPVRYGQLHFSRVNLRFDLHPSSQIAPALYWIEQCQGIVIGKKTRSRVNPNITAWRPLIVETRRCQPASSRAKSFRVDPDVLVCLSSRN